MSGHGGSAMSSLIRSSPKLDQRSALAPHWIGVRQSYFRNGLQRLAMVFRCWPRHLHLGPRRIGANHGKIGACGKTLMSGARGKDRDIACRDFDFTAVVAAEPH